MERKHGHVPRQVTDMRFLGNIARKTRKENKSQDN
jgi:hypothetical protein